MNRTVARAALAVAVALPALSLPLKGAMENAAMAAGVALRVMERVTTDLTAAPVRFGLQREAAADPFGGIEEQTPDKAAAWQIQVFDSAGRKVAFVQGRADPGGRAIPWGGTTTDGEPLPDGFYKARLVWFDAARKAYSTGLETISLVTPIEIRALAGYKLKFRYTAEGLIITIDEKLIFRPGASDLQPSAVPALDAVAKFLAAHPANKVDVRGYTDASGTADGNMKLSRERALKVYLRLVRGGVPEHRIAFTGLGAAQPLASNDTPEGRARNRRVDVVMLKPEENL